MEKKGNSNEGKQGRRRRRTPNMAKLAGEGIYSTQRKARSVKEGKKFLGRGGQARRK